MITPGSESLKECMAMALSYLFNFRLMCFGKFQVFYILLTFYGPVPGAMVIERSTDGGQTFQPWQYFAADCVASFSLQNNGPLTEPDSVNCVQYSE